MSQVGRLEFMAGGELLGGRRCVASHLGRTPLAADRRLHTGRSDHDSANCGTGGESDALADRITKHMDDQGWGLWAVEVPGIADFIGFVGLSPADDALGYPSVEVGWRLAAPYWGHGYATEGALAALTFGFHELALSEIVSFTSAGNIRSRRVMEKIGMVHRPEEDFDHPRIPQASPLCRHVLYRLTRAAYSTPE
jgi:RimJ/RimL family protein N-acetyltransferase